ncbi:MAG: trigger factor [Firmicutes bacterium]|nr:trigger factor [Bacillota bacterium]
MSSTVEKIEANKVKLTFSVDADRFEEGMKYSYNKNKNKINVQGFRKGKAPRKLIEAQYGKAIFYDDAINFVLPDAYESAVKENGLDVVSKPEIDVTAIDDNGVTFTAEVYTKPEVKAGTYKGLTFEKPDLEVSDEELELELKKDQEKNARIITVTDRPVQDGDIATIDFKGYIDDVAFEGGEGKDFDLEIGSHTFIDTFEEQLVGKSIGDDVTVNVTFPENYGKTDLAGKPAKFEVEIKEIKYKEYPELNDEFVQDTTEFETLEEYKNDIVGKLLAQKQIAAKNAKQESVLTQLIDNTEMDVPDAMIENDIDIKINEFSRNIQQQGLSLDMYLEYMGQNIQAMRDAYRPMSEKQVKGRLALEAVAKAEGFDATEEEIDAEIKRIAESYGMEYDKLKDVIREEDRKNLIEDIKVQKALDFVTDNVVEAPAEA